MNAKGGEKIPGNEFGASAFGLTAEGEADGEIGFGGEAGEDGILIAKIEVLGIGERFRAVFVRADVTFARAGGIEEDELLGMRKRKALKKNLTHDGEDGGVGADAESESEDGDGGEGGRFFEETEGEAGVLEEGFGDGEGLLVLDEEFGLFEAAELEEGVAAGFLVRHALGEVLLDG
jgi:hypothetical protein